MSIKEFQRVGQKAPAKTAASAAKGGRRSGAKDVVRPEEFATALANAVRGEGAMPEWAGKRVYASPQAKAFWEGEDVEFELYGLGPWPPRNPEDTGIKMHTGADLTRGVRI